jgi:hypothetical protein
MATQDRILGRSQIRNCSVAANTHWKRFASLLASAMVAMLTGCDSDPPGSRLDVLDLNGQAVDPFDSLQAKATVLLFTRTDCPISNRYAPEVRRLHEKFAPQGVTFYLVYLDPAEPVETIRRHLDQHNYPCRALRDPQHQLVQRSGATVTPEAAVFVPGGEMPYRGRIDDRFIDFGQTRAAPASHDLEDALAAILAGMPVKTPTTKAVGCYIGDLE